VPDEQEDPGSRARQDIHAIRDALTAGRDLTIHNYYPTGAAEQERAAGGPAVHRTIVAVDVEGFGDRHRTNRNQLAVRDGLYRAMQEAFRRAGIPWADHDHEDRGDGMFILVGPDVPKSLFVESLPSALVAALRGHNDVHPDTERIRLRMALHAGEVHYDQHGATAASINMTFRLLEAAPIKQALAGCPGVLAVITSSWFFEEVVRHSAVDVASYRPAPVTVKETSTTGWICLPDQQAQTFLDRGEELERVFYGLSNRTSPDFWLVISPPGLGKSWFLEQLADRAKSAGWVTKMVDLRVDATGRELVAMVIIGSLFGVEQPQSSGHEDGVLVVAQNIIRTGRPWLFLLDGAELLKGTTVTQLRHHLSKIYRLIQDTASAQTRLAFVVASQRDDGWRGIMPYPRLSILPLGEMGPSAVQEALERLAQRMPIVHSPAELRRDAALIQRVTEGVPGLVQQSLQWIDSEQWLGIERLNNPEFFDKITLPYIRDRLLAQDSLFPGEEGRREKQTKKLVALQNSLRVLVPYRFITLYHVHHHLDNDHSFRDALNNAGWSIEDLWQAIGGMALLYHPLDEAWHKIHPAIRRLLCRYFYAPEVCGEAHLRARDFTEAWAAQLTGKEQIIVMVESVWHEAVRLRLSSAATMGEDLIRFARTQSLTVRSSFNSVAELRNYAAQRMRDDDELQGEVGNVEGLFDKLVRVVLAPETQEAWYE
jgi:hypothetical protein